MEKLLAAEIEAAEKRAPEAPEAPEIGFMAGLLGLTGGDAEKNRDAEKRRKEQEEIELWKMGITILLHNIDINTLDTMRYSLLHKAIKCDSEAVVRLAVDAGADTYLKGFCGKDSLQMAFSSDNGEILELIVQARKKNDDL